MSLTRIHCSYHKNLTVYFQKVFDIMYNKIFKYSRGYKHFYSHIDEFLLYHRNYKISSINNHFLDIDNMDSNLRISRFIRDPRDLVISGYFYHKRGAEDWCNIINPKEEDWKIVNGHIPDNMPKDESYASFLNKISIEEGIKAEIDFREYHFNSMLRWGDKDNVLTIKYEDFLNNEKFTMDKIYRFYELPIIERKIGTFLAERYSAKKMKGKIEHIRNPKFSQWKTYFSKELINYFNNKYQALLDKYNY